jgi:hypothetical protein
VASAWASALALGITDEVFWDSTPEETLLLAMKLHERLTAERQANEYNANVRFGTIAAEIVNQSPWRRRGTRPLTWRSFFLDAAEQELDTPSALTAALLAWAEATPGIKKGAA